MSLINVICMNYQIAHKIVTMGLNLPLNHGV